MRVGLLATGLVSLAGNETRPLVPVAVRHALSLPLRGSEETAAEPVWQADRDAQLFAAAPELEVPYRQAVAWLRSARARQVGLATRENSWEYPLWALLRDRALPLPEIGHVCIDESAGPRTAWHPKYVVVIDRELTDTLLCDGAEYALSLKAPPLAGYVRVHYPPNLEGARDSLQDEPR